MKKLLILAAIFALAGCSNNYKNVVFPVKPKELDDCGFFRLENTKGQYLYVVRCPNSQTTVGTTGKSSQQVVVIDGVEYEKVKP